MAALRHLGLNRDPFAALPDSAANDAPAEGELSPNQARAWVLARLAQAGGDAALMAPGALGAIAYAAGGSPARLQRLAAAAMRHAADDGSRRIEMAHARLAIAEERGVEPAAERLPVEFPASFATALKPESVLPLAPRRTAVLPRWGVFALIGVSGLAGAAAILLVQGAIGGRGARTAPPRPSTLPGSEQVLPMLRESVADLTLAIPVADDRPIAVPAPAAAKVEASPTMKIEKAAAPPPVVKLAAAPAPPPALPKPRLVLRYSSDQPGAAEAASRVAALLRARGHDVAAVKGAPGRIRQASVRYADGERETGEAINDAYEAVLGAYQPGLASLAVAGDAKAGTLELWLPDSAAGASRPLRTDAPPV